jgi:hypothetical protein
MHPAYQLCHYAECRVSFVVNAECYYAECRYAECRGATRPLDFHKLSDCFLW